MKIPLKQHTKKLRRSKRVESSTDNVTKSKPYFKFGIALLIVALMIGNILIFAKSVRLSDTIVKLEEDSDQLKKENAKYQRELYEHNSLGNLEELAEQLGFSKESKPLYLEQSGYALNR